ncbi:MAG: hypothetical protein HOV66_02940 [Streptomycetaceae bacterium]|nr:hypothetical protein [Streptomycetaceae bacterium]
MGILVTAAGDVLARARRDGAAGSVWQVPDERRELDANVIHLPAGDRLSAPAGTDLDVLLVVLDGAGKLASAEGTVPVSAGSVVWMPRGTPRTVVAGPDGLSYFSVHRRRPPMTIGRA